MEAKFRNRTIEPGPPEPDGHRPFVPDGQRILPNFCHGIMGPGTWATAEESAAARDPVNSADEICLE